MKSLFFFLLLACFSWGNSYESWLKQEQQQFATFKENHDEAFSKAIKKEWEAFEANYTLNPYKELKPTVLPSLEEDSKLDISLLENAPLVKVEKPLIPKEKPLAKTPLPKIKKEDGSLKEVTVEFYSYQIPVQYNPHLGFLLTSVSKEAIANFWERFTHVDNQYLLSQIQSVVQHYAFNDWATYLFVHKIGMQIYGIENMANLFTWYVMTQMNYDVKIGYTQQNIYLLAHMKHELYQVTFLNLNEGKYYVLNPKGSIRTRESIYTYKARHEKAHTPLSFEFKKPLLFNTHFATKALHFKYNNQVHTLESQYSINWLSFTKLFLNQIILFILTPTTRHF